MTTALLAALVLARLPVSTEPARDETGIVVASSIVLAAGGTGRSAEIACRGYGTLSLLAHVQVEPGQLCPGTTIRVLGNLDDLSRSDPAQIVTEAEGLWWVDLCGYGGSAWVTFEGLSAGAVTLEWKTVEPTVLDVAVYLE